MAVAAASSYVGDNKVTKMIFSKYTLSYKWVIMYAKAVLKNLADEGLSSPSFSVSLPCEDNSRELSSWYLHIPRIFDSTETDKLKQIMIPMYLRQNESKNWTKVSKVLIMDCSFSVLNSNTGEVIHTIEIPARDCKLGQANSLENYGTEKFILYKGVTYSSSPYYSPHDKRRLGDVSVPTMKYLWNDTKSLQNNTLTILITANLLCLHGSVKKDVSLSLSIPPDNIRQQLKTVFDEKTLSDVSIECGGEVFQAHRIILASHSPVFKLMLETDMKEKNEKVITITDLDKEVVSDMLTFLYTGSAPNLKVLAKELLNVANKYQLPRLMVMCMYKLKEEIETDNVIEILQLADLHGVKELKGECLEFIKSDSKAVQKTTGWEDLKGNENSNSKSLYMEILEHIIA